MKLAHLILAHTNPVMLQRLVKRLQHEKADIYIQLDKKAKLEEFKHIGNLTNVYFVKKRLDTKWGDYSLIKATLTGFEYILAAGVEYSHINLLSGQDYPLKPAAVIQEFLFANADKTFMSFKNIGEDGWQEGMKRITRYSFGDYNFPGKYLMQKLASKILPDRKVPYDMKAYGQSQWLTITPKCAQYSIDFLKRRPDLKRFFRMTWAVDEVFFQTILVNSLLRNQLVNDNLRYIEQTSHRPKTFTLADADKLMRSGKFYARKFNDSVDTAILDRLDKLIGTHPISAITVKPKRKKIVNLA